MNGLSRYWATPSDTAARTTARSRAEVTAITSTRLPGGPQRPADVQAVQVGQVEVEQDEVDAPPSLARRAAIAARRCAPRRRPRSRAPVRCTRRCASASSGSSSTTSTRIVRSRLLDRRPGRRTVNTAPPSSGGHLDAAAVPADRPARPAPGRGRAPVLPWWTSRAGTRRPPGPAASPGPLSATRISSSSRTAPTKTCTRAAPARRPPRPGRCRSGCRRSSQVAGRQRRCRRARQSGSMTRSTPRSPACADLPSSSAASAGSVTAPTTRSVSCWASASSAVANPPPRRRGPARPG